MSYLHAGRFESSHKHLKIYTFSSERTKTVTEEFTAKKYRPKLFHETLRSRKETLRNQNSSRVRANKNDDAYLVNAGPFTTVAVIEDLLQKGKLFSGLKQIVNCKKSLILNCWNDSKPLGTRPFVNF